MVYQKKKKYKISKALLLEAIKIVKESNQNQTLLEQLLSNYNSIIKLILELE